MSSAVSWEFQLDGDEVDDRTWDWRRGAPPVQLLRSVRRPTSHSRSRHIPVRACSMRLGTTLRVESGLEHDLVRVLDRDPTVAWMVAQPCRLQFDPEVGKPFPHVPDLLVQSVSGEVTVWDARPAERADEKFGRVAELTRRACAEVGWSYRLFHGLGDERLNLLWLHGFRAGRPWHDAWRTSLVQAVESAGTDAVLVEDLLGLDDGSGEAISTLWHLIWSGDLHIDLAAPITAHTVVARQTATREERS